MATCSGYDLATRVLYHPQGGVAELIQLANGQETDWLEFKAAIREPGDDRTIRADLAWHVARALIAMMNTTGGAVLLGYDDRAQAIGLSASDPDGVILSEGIETFIRTRVAPSLLPENGQWNTSRGIWRVEHGRLQNSVSFQNLLIDDKPILVCLVKPAEQSLLDAEHLHNNIPRNVLLVRQQGMGRVRELVRRHEWDEHVSHREVDRADLGLLAEPFSLGPSQPQPGEALPEDTPRDEELMQRVADVLQEMPNGGSAHQIMHRLGTVERVDHISNALCALHECGVVRLIGGATWKVPLFDDAVTTQQKPIEDYGGWDTARKMFRYYADCIEDEAGGMCRSFANGENQSFIRIRQSIPWEDLAFGESLIVPCSILPDGFLKQPSLLDRDYYMGAPTQCIWSERHRRMTAIVPVFVLPVRLRLLSEQRQLVIRPTGPIQVNASWLTFKYNRAQEDQQKFVEQMGLGAAQRIEFGIPVPARMSALQEGLRFFVGKEWRSTIIRDPNTRLEQYTDGGYFDFTVLMRRERSTITGRLLTELRSLADPLKVSDEQLDKTALAPLFARKSTQMDTPEYPLGIAHVDALGLEQQQAIRIARESNVGVVQGPPGTGKSRVVKNIMIDQALNAKSVLLASGNHQALDAVLPSVNECAELLFYAVRLSYPFQQGNPSPAQMNPLLEPLRHLARNEGQCGRDDIEIYNRHTLNIQEATERYCKNKQALGKLAELEMRHSDEDTELHAKWDESFTGRLFDLQALSRWQSQLPPPDQLNRDLAALRRLHDLFAKHSILATWLAGLFAYCAKKTLERASSLANTLEEAPTYSRDYAGLIKICDRSLAVHHMITLLNAKNDTQKEIDRFYTLDQLRDSMSKASTDAHAASLALLKQQANICGHCIQGQEKELLDAMVKIMGERRVPAFSIIKRMMERAGRDFAWFCKYFPLWGVTTLSAGKFVPLKEGLFDLLVIDEATQCNIASVIPLLFRAKRALIVGDPEQLQFVASIHKRREEQLRAKQGLLEAGWFYRFHHHKQSMFGLAASSSLVSGNDKQFLRDHFRCHRDIANYFNKNFYNERLFVNTPRPRFNEADVGIRWTQVVGDAQAASGGGAISPAQITAIVEELRKLRGRNFPGTVGVVTPFTAQANRINDAIYGAFGRDIPQHWNFKASTADGFQGGERDVILFSLVGGDGMPQGSSWFYEQDRNRFNVAVSRAKVLLHVFGDREWVRRWSLAKPDQRAHLAQLVAFADKSKSKPAQFNWTEWRLQHPNEPPVIGDASRIGPVWEPDFARKLYQQALPVMQQYPRLGRYLDIAIQDDKERARLAVEVDGEAYHRDISGQRRVEDIERDIVLIANGWAVQRFWVYELRENMDECIDRVRSLWADMNREQRHE